MLVDDVAIQIKAGNGGKGFLHFLRTRNAPKGGPDGGDGSNGGNIYFQAVSDITKLSQFRYAKKFKAPNGMQGEENNRRPKDGEDLILEIPVGTVVSYDNGTGYEMTEVGQKIMAARGGTGGWGNSHFKAPDNTTPMETTPGFLTEIKNIHLTLKLIADIGLIGLPNAGKSSLLNELTRAHARVANYPFTTLEPNLGVTITDKVLADIPGLIEGANLGKGLGAKFLKHIERTKLLVHCVSCENEDVQKAYQTVRKELSDYSSQLASKPELILLTKSDLCNEKELKIKVKELKPDLVVSILDENSLKQLLKLFSK